MGEGGVSKKGKQVKMLLLRVLVAAEYLVTFDHNGLSLLTF